MTLTHGSIGYAPIWKGRTVSIAAMEQVSWAANSTISTFMRLSCGFWWKKSKWSVCNSIAWALFQSRLSGKWLARTYFNRGTVRNLMTRLDSQNVNQSVITNRLRIWLKIEWRKHFTNRVPWEMTIKSGKLVIEKLATKRRTEEEGRQ